MRRGIRIIVLVLACSILAPLVSLATPAFSRQIHADCYTCHFQSMGALNAFGRAFEMNNFNLTPKMRKELLEYKKRERDKRNIKSGKNYR